MKKQVHFSILKDMQKYIPDVNPEEYETCFSCATDESIINEVREYYDKHLPVDLTAWIRVNEPDKNLIFRDKLREQICFVRDELYPLLVADYSEMRDNPVMVISTHISKSVILPVYQFNLKKYGIEIVLRNNFFNWIISVNSEKPVKCNFMGLFDLGKEIPYYYCEGFPREKVYGSYKKDHRKFTFEVISFHDVYVFCYLLRNYLGIKKD
jgi:hypothetical protein